MGSFVVPCVVMSELVSVRFMDGLVVGGLVGSLVLVELVLSELESLDRILVIVNCLAMGLGMLDVVVRHFSFHIVVGSLSDFINIGQGASLVVGGVFFKLGKELGRESF